MERSRSGRQSGALLGCLIVGAFGCAGPAAEKSAERKFYKNPQVRRCLEFDRDQRSQESQSCWVELLAKLESDAAYRAASELSDADVSKIRQRAGQSAGKSHGLRRELDQCFNLPSNRRDDRLACFEDYLKRNRDRLSVAERYEVETSISAMQQARELASGNVEHTVEHASKLLGARLYLEDEGVRIDAIEAAPASQAGLPEQGIIVALDGTPVSELDSAERIARLEACQDHPVDLLVRQGGAGEVTFVRSECRCGAQPAGRKLGQVRLPAEVCTGPSSAELKLGISWCYLTRDGLLEVEEVCKDSPAAAAGVRPDHQYVRINGRHILGLTYPQIGELLAVHPAEPLRFESRAGALQSPGPLTGAPLGAEQAERFWQAVRQSLQLEEKPTSK